MPHCVVVRAYGEKLDHLRGEANRIARNNKSDWWAETTEKGTSFCFADINAKSLFTAICERENIQLT
jgi:hypothetical protein